MKVSVFITTLSTTFFLLVITPVASYNVVCYFSSSAIYRPSKGKFDVSDIDAHLCTHINFGFVDLTKDGSLHIIDPWESNDDGNYHGFSNLKALKSANPDLKVLISLGGSSEGSKNFSAVAADQIKRRRIAWQILVLIEKYNFDGVDIYWEYPTLGDNGNPEDKENFIEMLQVFKNMYHAKGLLVTAAVSGTVDTIESSYNVEKVSELVDMLNIMAFDYHGAFDSFVGHNSPLHASSKDYDNGRNATYTVATGVEYWIYKNADPKKINMGIATYGRTFTLADKANTQLYAPISGPGTEGPYTKTPGTLGYNEICEFYTDSTYVWDDEQKVPHRVWEDQWAGFENKSSIQLKVDFAVTQNLAGLVIKSIDTDDFLGRCGEKYPLLNTIKNRLVYHENENKYYV
jgi:chitinase